LLKFGESCSTLVEVLFPYVPLLERAYQNWKALESETGSQVYCKTG
jgi:hypothetical protein